MEHFRRSKPKEDGLVHRVKLKGGLVVFLPTSIPDSLLPFTKTDHLFFAKEDDDTSEEAFDLEPHDNKPR